MNPHNPQNSGTARVYCQEKTRASVKIAGLKQGIPSHDAFTVLMPNVAQETSRLPCSRLL
jgi:hypothetical protein